MFLKSVGKSGGSLSNCLYRPDELRSTYAPRKYLVRKATFTNFSLSKTIVEDLEFVDCTFTDCRFIGTIFRRCRFTNCTFTNCNTYRMELEHVFVDPRAFANSIPKRNYSNIGLSLFQELLQNSRAQSQPDFSDEAHYQFRRWQRKQFLKEAKEEGLSLHSARKCFQAFWLYILEVCVGSGVRLSALARSVAVLLGALSALNWQCRHHFGLPIQTWQDAIYFSTVTLTTLGFGDIAPTTEIGRIAVSFEAMFGLILFATMASMIYRKIST